MRLRAASGIELSSAEERVSCARVTFVASSWVRGRVRLPRVVLCDPLRSRSAVTGALACQWP